MQSLGLTLAKGRSRLRWRLRLAAARLGAGALPRRVVFLHIPKTAGSSVGLHFKTHMGSTRSATVTYLDDTAGPPDEAALAAARASFFVGGHFGWDTLRAIRGDAFVFTFLRDPLERLRSAYLHAVAVRGPAFARRYPRFQDYLASADPAVLTQTDNAMARPLAGAALAHDDAVVLARAAIAHLATFDHVGFLDRFEADAERIAAAAGLPPPPAERRVNVTNDKFAAGAALPDMTLDAAGEEIARRRIAADAIVYEHALANVRGGRLEAAMA